jgi:hypothetical protein
MQTGKTQDDKTVHVHAATRWVAGEGPLTEVEVTAKAAGSPADVLAVASSRTGAPAPAVAAVAIGILDARAAEARRQLEDQGLLVRRAPRPELDEVDPAAFAAEVEAMRGVARALAIPEKHRPSQVLGALRLVGWTLQRATTCGIQRSSEDHERVTRLVGLTGGSRETYAPATIATSDAAQQRFAGGFSTARPAALSRVLGGTDQGLRPEFRGRLTRQAYTLGQMRDAGVPESGLAVARELSDFGRRTPAGQVPLCIGAEDALVLADALFSAGAQLACLRAPRFGDASTLGEANVAIAEQQRALVALRAQLSERDAELLDARRACKVLREERDASRTHWDGVHHREKLEFADRANRATTALAEAQAELAKVRAQLAAQEARSVAAARSLAAVQDGRIACLNFGHPDYGTQDSATVRPHPTRGADGYAQSTVTFRKTDACGHFLVTRVERDVPPPSTRVVNRGTDDAPRFVVEDMPALKPRDKVRIVDRSSAYYGRVGEVRGRGQLADEWAVAWPDDRSYCYKRVQLEVVVEPPPAPVAAPAKRTKTVYGAYHWAIPAGARNVRQDGSGTWSYDVEEGAEATAKTPAIAGATDKSGGRTVGGPVKKVSDLWPKFTFGLDPWKVGK